MSSARHEPFDPGESYGSHDFRTPRRNDVHLVRIGPERYETPAAVTIGA